MFYTYIIYSEKYNRYYIGHCEVLSARLLRHNSKMVTATRNFVPWHFVYYEEYSTKLEANRRELHIKKMKSRKYIENLIKNFDKELPQ
jgi:putative endonuclease